jgi:membrane protein implicated in regulation of membrane protease activity
MDGFTAFMADISEWAWIAWLVLIAVFLVIEMLTLDFTFLMLSFGGLIGLIGGLLGLPWWAQLIVAAVAAALFTFFLRPPLLHRLRRGEDLVKSNVDALMGLQGTALLDITQITGQVKLSNGDIWTARSADGAPILAGTRIAVADISGATALVRPVTE